MHILIVEDHEASAQALARMLEKKSKGLAVCHIAGTLTEGLRMARETVMDITLVDLCLPDAAVQEVIASIPLFTHPVIIVTDLDDPASELEIACYSYCAQNFFSKHALRQEIFEHEGSTLFSAIIKANWRDRLPAERRAREAQHV